MKLMKMRATAIQMKAVRKRSRRMVVRGKTNACNIIVIIEQQQCKEPSQNEGPAFAIQYFNKLLGPEDLREEE